MIKVQSDRQNYIDWLRAGAMFLLVFYHSGRLFDEEPWHIKNAVLNEGINVFNRILDIWHMPLFFLLAGCSVWFALTYRTPGSFSKERVLRLLVPLIFGMLIIVPPQVYIERIFDGDFSGSFFAWYPHTFQGTYSMDNPASGNLSWHHLWFLAYLFVFSLLLVPIFWYFKSQKRKLLINKIAGFLEKPGAIYLPSVPLIIVNIFLRPIYGSGNQNLVNDWANFCFYILVFFYGFLLVSDKRILNVFQRDRYIGLASAVIITFIIYLLEARIIATEGIVRTVVYSITYAVACWCYLIAAIGIGSRLLNFGNKLLNYSCDAVLPVYILHQSVIVVSGYYIIQWNTGVDVKYPAVVFGTFVISLGIYEIVRRINLTRFLFGIKSKKKRVVTGSESKTAVKV
jgi:glucans biosynthesis protein C